MRESWRWEKYFEGWVYDKKKRHILKWIDAKKEMELVKIAQGMDDLRDDRHDRRIFFLENNDTLLFEVVYSFIFVREIYEFKIFSFKYYSQ